MTKIVITGGAGFCGSNLGYMLSRNGYDVLLLDDLSYGHLENLKRENKSFGKFIKFDIRSKDLNTYFSDADCIFHFAAISTLPVCQNEPLNSFDVNVSGTANVLEAARLSDVRRVVFASTGAVYENNTEFPCKEDDEVSPLLNYGQSKVFGEKLCNSYSKLYGMEVAITRYNNVYGPNQDIKRISPPFVAYLIRELLQNNTPTLFSNGEQRRDYVYIDDVNRLNMLCMTHPKAVGEIFNVSSGISYSVNEIYQIIASILQSDIKPLFKNSASFWDSYPSLFSGKFKIDKKWVSKEVDKFTLGSYEKAERLLNWKATTTLEQGLKLTIEHAKKTLFD